MRVCAEFVPSRDRTITTLRIRSTFSVMNRLIIRASLLPRRCRVQSAGSVHCLSTFRKKQRDRERAERFSAKLKASDSSNLPQFTDLLKKLYMRSHPDLLRASDPEKAAINDSSMQVLNGILTTVKAQTEFPTANLQTIPFYVRKSNSVELINLTLKTAGGDSRHQLARCFEDFFGRAGIAEGKFQWGKDYFSDALTNEEEIESSSKASP